MADMNLSATETLRYQALAKLGKRVFANSQIIKSGEINEDDILLAKKFIGSAITASNPQVWASWFEHVFISARLAGQLDQNSEFFLWLHEIGRLVTPSAYFQNDNINNQLLAEFTLPQKIIDQSFPMGSLLQLSGELNFTQSQLEWKEPLSDYQKTKAGEFYNRLSHAQKIINLADNLGKRNENGLFDIKGFFEYLKTQEQRYENTSNSSEENWSIPRRPGSTLLQVFIVEKTLKWLQNLGINIEKVLWKLDSFGPKFTIVIRHGEISNPKGIVYNLDEVMKEKDIIHLSQYGKTQMIALGRIIKQRKFNIACIITSDQIRAIESAQALNTVLEVKDFQINAKLKEVFAPGPYKRGLTMDEFKKSMGDAYDAKLWGEFKHETIENVFNRMNDGFLSIINQLKPNQTGVMVSHGDPLAWWINFHASGKLPDPKNLRQHIYPNKGQALAVVIDENNKWFSYYFIEDPSLLPGTSY